MFDLSKSKVIISNVVIKLFWLRVHNDLMNTDSAWKFLLVFVDFFVFDFENEIMNVHALVDI